MLSVNNSMKEVIFAKPIKVEIIRTTTTTKKIKNLRYKEREMKQQNYKEYRECVLPKLNIWYKHRFATRFFSS